MKKAVSLALVMLLGLCGCSANQGNQTSGKTEVSVPSQVSEESKAESSEEESKEEESKLPEPESRDVFAMDTYMVLKAYGSNAKKALEDAETEIKRLESLFSVKLYDSDISKINANSGNPITVNASTRTAIAKAIEVGNMTDGALDISVYPIVREWGFTTGDSENEPYYKIPDQWLIDWHLGNVGYEKIIINGSIVTVPTEMEIDLGAVAKGYASDAVLQILDENKIQSALINLGGNVYALGRKPDNTKWKVGIQNPVDKDKMICTLAIENKAVITSGNYERCFEMDGKKYWHIIDPKTGYPADNGIISATVIGDSGLDCDALSTALFVMGTEKAIEFCKSHKEIDVILVTKDMKIYATEGLEKIMTMEDGLTYEKIKR